MIRRRLKRFLMIAGLCLVSQLAACSLPTGTQQATDGASPAEALAQQLQTFVHDLGLEALAAYLL